VVHLELHGAAVEMNEATLGFEELHTRARITLEPQRRTVVELALFGHASGREPITCRHDNGGCGRGTTTDFVSDAGRHDRERRSQGQRDLQPPNARAACREPAVLGG
jgi:hypothetical protein